MDEQALRQDSAERVRRYLARWYGDQPNSCDNDEIDEDDPDSPTVGDLRRLSANPET